MTREEFIGRAADAILAQRMGRLLVPQASDDARYEAVQWATAALDAVGAWGLLGALDAVAVMTGNVDIRRIAKAAIAKAVCRG